MPPARPWPDPLGTEVYHGITGEYLRLVSPATEADDATLLYHYLAIMGAFIGLVRTRQSDPSSIPPGSTSCSSVPRREAGRERDRDTRCA